MANTIAIARGVDNTRVKETHRLGSVRAVAEANTWRTFATVTVNANGAAHVTVKRDGVTVHTFELGPENDDVDAIVRAYGYPVGPEGQEGGAS